MRFQFLSLATAFAVLSVPSGSPCAAQARTWTHSIYLGASRGEDLHVTNDANLSAQLMSFHVPERSGWALGGELGILGLGENGFGGEAIDGGTFGGTARYGSVFLGAGIRSMGIVGRRVRPYVGVGSAIHVMRTPGVTLTPDPAVRIRPGASLSVGVYGLAPGYFGIEARTHVVAAGRGEGMGGPLVIYSLLAGFNAF